MSLLLFDKRVQPFEKQKAQFFQNHFNAIATAATCALMIGATYVIVGYVLPQRTQHYFEEQARYTPQAVRCSALQQTPVAQRTITQHTLEDECESHE